MMWVKGQPWRVVNALQKLNEQIRAYAPRSLPPATDPKSWGSLADDEHSSTSDHYPHFYAALGTEAVVCARDFPQAPALGLDGGIVTEALRISRDSRIGYLIFNRRITGPNHGWVWEHYDGSDPHDTHFHVSSVHTAAADDTRVWTLPGTSAKAPLPIGESAMLVTCTNGSGAEKSINDLAVPANGRVVLTPVGPWSVASASNFDTTYWKNTLWLTWAEIKDLCDALKLPPGSPASQADVIAALQSPEGQAALAQAANTAEDS